MKDKLIKNIPVQARASLAFFIANVVTAGISYITTPIFTRLITVDEFGKTSVFLTWLQVFGIIAMFCLSYGVFNNGMIDYPDKRDEYSFSMLILSNILTIIFSVVIICIYPLISDWLNMDLPFVVLMCVLFLFQPAYNFWIAKQRYEYKYKGVLFWSVVCSVVSPLTAIIIIILNNSNTNLYPRIFGSQCPLIFIYIGFYVYTGFKNSWKLNSKYWKTAFLFNLPLIPHYLSTYLLSSCDKIMISKLINDNATAFYSIAHSIASVATIIWAAINSSLIPYTYEKCKEEEYSDINKITLPLITVFAFACILVILLAPEAVRIMATDDYMESIFVIPPIVGGVFFQVQYYIYANIVYYYKKPVFVMIGSISAVILNIILNYFCIQKWGYIAAGYTTIICYSVQAIIDYYAMKSIVKNSIYNMKYIIILSITVIIISLFSNITYGYPIIRYSILIILIIIAVIFKNNILKAFKFKD